MDLKSPLFVKNTRIFSPNEIDMLLEAIPKEHSRTIFNVMLWTGMRYVEIQRLHGHPEWFIKDRNYIRLDKIASKKVKRKAEARNIPVAPQLQGELPYFFKNKQPPTLQTWDENLKRWALKAGIGPEKISAKSTRKTIEAWMHTIGMDSIEICTRQGHDSLTALRHYRESISFSPDEISEIERRLSGWK